MAELSIGRAIRGSLSSALVMLGVLGTDSAARAQSQEADEQCHEAYVGRPQTIEICGALIDSGRAAGKDLAAAYNQRGKAYTSQRQYDRAISDFDEAIRIDPAFIDAYVDRVHARALGGDIDRGIEDIDRAILLDPDNPDSLMTRASWYRSKGEANHYYRTLALNDLDRVVELDRPDPAMAFHMRADILQRMGLHARAIEDYSKVIQADLADHWITGAWLGRCRSEEALELFREAVASCSQVVQRKGPDYGYATLARGIVFLKMNEFDAAIADLDAAAKRLLYPAQAFFARGVAKRRTGNIAGGDSDVLAAIRMDANVVEKMDKRGVKP